MSKKPAKPRAQYTDDNFYHQFFSNAEVVADLIKTVQPALLAELDLNSLDQGANPDACKEDGWLYIYILLEFKSRQERFCSLQVLEYIVLAYRDLINKKALTANNKLPPLLPIVLYNGDPPLETTQVLGRID